MPLSLENARGVPSAVWLLWVAVVVLLGALHIGFKGSIQV